MRHYLLIFCLLWGVASSTLAQDNVVDVSISNPQPYIGEQITYTVTFTSSLDLADTQIQLPQFVGFAQEPQTPTLSTIPINSVIQNVIQQDVILYPNRTGEIPLDRTTVIVPDTPFQSGIEVTGRSVTLNVLPLPDGAPDTFTGGVGQFEISATLNSATVQAGDPHVMRISVTGVGNFSQIDSPPLPFPDTWEIFEGSSTTTSTGANLQTKTFEYQFFANQTGSLDIPAITFSYFDPLTASYRTLTTEVGSISVEGEFATSSTNTTIQADNRLELKPMSDQPDNLMPSTTFWFMWGIAPLIAVIFTLSRLATRPAQPKATRSTRKQSKSLKAVSSQLALARKSDPNQAYGIVEQTIFQYLSSKFKQDVDSSNLQDITSPLPDIIQQRLTVCIEQSQAGRYAPVTPEDAQKLIRRTYKTLQMIEEQRL